MSEDYQLARTLLWSDTDFALSEFVEKYELPQVILVEVGYCGEDERTTFSSDQILTLHALRTNSKIVCIVPPGNAVLVPPSCALKAEVIPMECNERIVNAQQLSSVYKKVKYIRVFETGSTRNNNNIPDTLKVGDILQIKKVDTGNSELRCRNTKTDASIVIPTNSTAAFVPLAGPNTYTLAEIQKHFGLPAKMRFTDKRAEMRMRTVPGERQPLTMLSSLDQITAVEEIHDQDVIVTTVCSKPEETVCLNVPTTLDIRVTVAEGFLKGDETYQKVVKTLNGSFKSTDLSVFEDLKIFPHDEAVKREMDNHLIVEQASREIKERARKRLEEVMRHKATKFTDKFSRPPKIPPRRQSQKINKAPPPRPPKRPPKTAAKPVPNPAERPEPKKRGASLTERLKSLPLGRKPSTESSLSGTTESISSDEVYEEPDSIYSSIGDEINVDVFDDTDSDDYDDPSTYTELDATYAPKSSRSYEPLLRNEPPKATTLRFSQSNPLPSTPPIQKKSMSLPANTHLPPTPQAFIPPPLPTSKPPCPEEDRQAIYEAIARYPQDLTGLSVSDVSKLLRYLNLGDYVQTFETELIDGTMLSDLDKDLLESFNVKPFHCKKLLDFIGGWRPKV